MPKGTRRRLTEAERDARRQADRGRIEQAARALLTSDGWQRWIRAGSASAPPTVCRATACLSEALSVVIT
jgi:hypothetical protein